jgi:hypothetical protein
MKKLSILHVPAWSFFSTALYREVGLTWRGGVALFVWLYLLVAASVAVQMGRVHAGFSEFIDEEVPKMTRQWPTVTVRDGRLSIDEPSPHFIVPPNAKQPFIPPPIEGRTTPPATTEPTVGEAQPAEAIVCFAMEGEYETPKEARSLILVTPHRVIQQKNEFQTQAHELSDIEEDVTISRSDIEGGIDRYSGWVLPVLGAVIAVFFAVWRTVEVLILGLIGKAFTSGQRVVLSYGALVRLAIVALTPALILDLVLTAAGVGKYGHWLIFLGIGVAYLYLGVYACRGPKLPPPSPAGVPASGR